MQIAAISMPTWDLTIAEGKLVKWLAPEGSMVVPAIPIAVIWHEEDATLSPAVLSQLPVSIATHAIPAAGHMPRLKAQSVVNVVLAVHMRLAS